MKICWLNRQDNPDCILFMAGWAMGPEPFAAMAAGAVDVMMVYDYQNLDDCELLSLLSKYNKYRIHLLAWSMGVWAAGRLLKDIAFSSSTAIGGTCTPIDNKYGIPDQIFDETIADFSAAMLNGFYSAMFETPEQARLFLDNPPNRPRQELKEELIALRSACRILPKADDIFDRRIVTGRDRIFPARNQIRFWGRDNCESRPLPHFPFYQWPSWAELLAVAAK